MNIPRRQVQVLVPHLRVDVNALGTPTTWSDFNIHTLGNQEKTGVPVPNWKDKIAKGLDASSDYFREDVDGKPPSYKLKSQAKVSGKYEYSTVFQGGDITPEAVHMFDTSAALRDRALGKLYRKIHKATGEYNALVPIGELKDLHGTARKSFELTHTFFNTLLMNRRVRNPLGFMHWLADAWLTWSFGVVPMANDVQEIARVIDEKLKEHKKVSFSASAKQPIERSAVADFGAKSKHVGIMRHHRWNAELKYRFTCKYDYNPVIAGNDYGYLSKLNLDLNSLGAFVPTLWELLPWSWFVDYFVTVGSYLEDTFLLDPKPLVFMTEARSIKGTSYDILTPYLITNLPFRTEVKMTDWSTEPAKIKRFLYDRKKVSGLPGRIIRFKFADEIAKNYGNKCLNLLSIIANRRG